MQLWRHDSGVRQHIIAPRITYQVVEESFRQKNSDDLKDETTTDNVLTTDGQWMGDPNLRSHKESTKRAQRGLKEGSKMAIDR